ncbi:MAG: CotH kinase family protein [Bacteroidaceae bacterium]|nr:CotH kinase family protein [Bacteroidaceae bacterium]
MRFIHSPFAPIAPLCSALLCRINSRTRPSVSRYALSAFFLAALLLLAACSGGGDDIIPPKPEPEPTPEPTPPEPEPDPKPAVEAKYIPSKIEINTVGAQPIKSREKKDTVHCTVAITSDVEGWSAVLDGRIRGRGNSTWLWYPKKPYRLKLTDGAEVLGMASNKDWVFLANYRDPTHLMNSFVFLLGQKMGLPFTNNVRYAEVTLNGEYIGLYQITEQIKQGKNRVNIDKKEGILLALDRDDGPELSQEGDNFWSKVYQMPVCVKHPEDDADYDLIRDEFAIVEQAVKSADYDTADKVLDIKSLIDYLIIQELVENVELVAPRSVYFYRDKGGKWTAGPLWDFDAGFDFDWTNMTTSHNYFKDYRELVLGTKPATHQGSYDPWGLPYFFTDLFKSQKFVKQYKDRWAEIKPQIMSDVWVEMMNYYKGNEYAVKRDNEKWPIGKNHSTEVSSMQQWLNRRISYLDAIIQDY